VDLGVGGVSGVPAEEGQFKMASLRNVEKTAPYMHDGRFATLEEVVDFYSDGVVDHPGLPGLFRDGDELRRPEFTAEEKAALVALLKTLTDNQFLTDQRFSDPFRR
jgi:cytochrome c peroxidase